MSVDADNPDKRPISRDRKFQCVYALTTARTHLRHSRHRSAITRVANDKILTENCIKQRIHETANFTCDTAPIYERRVARLLRNAHFACAQLADIKKRCTLQTAENDD